MEEQSRKHIVILGPTASGKSEAAAILAARLKTSVISVDARQCYRELDTGTAKPEPELLEVAPHYYISLLNPVEKETARDFRRRCDAWEKEIPADKPIVYTGGSTLYLQAVLFDFDEVPAANPVNMENLMQREKAEGLEGLYAELQKKDPVYAKKMDGMNRHRIYRALDVFMQSGKPYSGFHSENTFTKPREGFRVFGLEWPVKMQHERIEKRVLKMLENGLVEETELLVKRYGTEVQALQTVGYREVIRHLQGDLSREQMIQDIMTNTRRYARRQRTWFRRWSFIEWLKADNRTAEEIVGEIRSKTSL